MTKHKTIKTQLGERRNIALVLTGIGLALATIVRALRWQTNRLWDILS